MANPPVRPIIYFHTDWWGNSYIEPQSLLKAAYSNAADGVSLHDFARNLERLVNNRRND